MCGIFGALGRMDGDALDRAAAAIDHRGPDARGRYVDDQVSLLHARLRIIDLTDAGAQPMANEDGSVRLVFNGEIYNHHQLRSRLESRFSFRSRSDTEAILRGYEAWGPAVIDEIDGMFALAIWDARAGRLLLARDRTGKKPLFYSERGGVLRFGSTISSLLAAGTPGEVDLEALPYYLAYGFVPEPMTIYRGVHQLGPAERLVVDKGRLGAPTRYWSPPFGSAPVSDDYPTAVDKVRHLVEAAVERRLESDVPLGAFLSGGIDSSIIVGVMAKRIRKVRTFSIGFAGDARYDETSFARIVAERFGTDHTEFTLQPSSFELVETLIRHHDGPFGDSSAIPTYVVSQLTRQHVTVALTGDGGDELFCGYHRFLAAEVAERTPALLRKTAGLLANRVPASSDRSLVGKGVRYLRAAALPLADRMARWNSFFYEPGSILRADLRAQLGDGVNAPLAWQRSVFAQCHGDSTIRRILEHNFRTYLPCDLLVKADRCSMAHALELRAPFLDSALIAYAARLPPAYLRRGTLTKRVLKDAFSDLLPTEIRNRGKLGFGVPIGTWFRTELRGYLRDHLGAGARCDQYLDRAQVDRLLDEHERSVADHGQRLWALLTLEIWLRGLGRPASNA